MAGALGLRPGDRVLAPLPLFHINPMGYGIITALLTGADALTVRKFSASGLWPAVVGERVTVLILHAPPVEILKKATSRPRRRRAPGPHHVLRRRRVPGPVRASRRRCPATARPRRAASST